jgi:hypothetical protein
MEEVEKDLSTLEDESNAVPSNVYYTFSGRYRKRECKTGTRWFAPGVWHTLDQCKQKCRENTKCRAIMIEDRGRQSYPAHKKFICLLNTACNGSRGDARYSLLWKHTRYHPTPSPTTAEPTHAPTDPPLDPHFNGKWYEFPQTLTSEFVHGICFHSAKPLTALAREPMHPWLEREGPLYYEPIENLASGTQVWADRSNFKFTGVEGSPCEGATYLQPSKHKYIPPGTVITVTAANGGEFTGKICMLVEKENKYVRDGGFPENLPASDPLIENYGSSTSLGWNGGSFLVYCRTFS